MRVMFRPKIKLEGFFPARKATDERWEVVAAHHEGNDCDYDDNDE